MPTHDEKIKSVIHALKIISTDAVKSSKNGAIAPTREGIISIIKEMNSIMFPEYYCPPGLTEKRQEELINSLFDRIKQEISAAYSLDQATAQSEEATAQSEEATAQSEEATVQSKEMAARCEEKRSPAEQKNAHPSAQDLAYQLIEGIPRIKSALIKDVAAIYEGDPAAASPAEVILAYPGFYAISIYRIAHEFFIRGIPYIPRLMTEFAHEKTGIDIHPGAKIGEYFCIDHGTGIVIGETTTIGDRVKIYQGVTLGARSVEVDRNGKVKKGKKRHPDIGDGTVIYANATILGADTRIGEGSVIGGNVWLTRSVPANSKIYYETPKNSK